MKRKFDTKELLSKYWDVLLVFVIYGAIHIFVHTDYWDDATMKTLVSTPEFSVINNLRELWNVWTSRLITEVVLDIVIMMPDVVWRILDTLCIGCLYINLKSILKLVYKKELSNSEKFIVYLLFMSIPFSLFATAGWMVTTICYLWIITAFSFAILILIKAINHKILVIEYIVYALLLLFFGNYDVTGFISLGMVIIFFVVYKDRAIGNSFIKVTLLGIVMSIINIIMFAICPGNRVRQVLDASYHDTSELLDIGVLGKMRMGINSCFYHFVSVPNILLFLTLLIIAVVVICDEKSNLFMKVLGMIAVLLDSVCTIYVFAVYSVKNRRITYVYPDGLFEHNNKIEQYVIMFSAITIVFVVTYMLLTYIKDIKLAIITVAVFYIWGLMPQVALGFTTTVSTSCIRMVLYLYYSFLFIDMILLAQNVWNNNKNRIIIDRLFIALGSIGMLLNLLQVIRHIMVYG